MLVQAMALAWLLGAARGQEPAQPPRSWLRLLPVGEAPPFLQEIRGGVRHELEAPPGTVPPRVVKVPSPKGGDQAAAEIRLNLGSMSEPVMVTAGLLRLSPGRDGDKAAKWLEFTMPQRPTLVVVFRNPGGKSWESVVGVSMADDAASFPAGRLRFVNATPYQADIGFHGQITLLKPGQVMVKEAPAGGVLKDAPLMVAVRGTDEKSVRVFDGTVSQDPGERTNIVIHWTDGVSPRRPAKVLMLRERPPVHKVPEDR